MAIDFPNNPANGETYNYQVNIVDPAEPDTVLYIRNVLYTYSQPKDSWTGTIVSSSRIANPSPDEVSASPPFSNAGEVDAGTEQNPYQLNPQVAPTPGGTINSDQLVTFVRQVSGERVLFQDFSDHSNTRFQQFVAIIDGLGSATIPIRYEDDPTTPQEADGTEYTMLSKVGSTWFTWTVTQQVAQPILEDKETTISVTGNVWDVGQTAVMSPGTAKSGTPPYAYKYNWQRSEDGSVWTNATPPEDEIENPNVLSYFLTEADQGFFIRGVTIATDETTPVAQTITLNSSNSITQVKGPPRIAEVALRRQTASQVNRYSNQTYTSFIVMGNDGTGGHVKSIKAIFQLPNDALRYATIEATSGEITAIVDTDPGFVTTTQQGNINIKFPVSFADGQAPDTLLPEGTSMVTSVNASNAEGNSIVNSNIFVPELPDIVAFPAPDILGSEMQQNDDAFTPSPNPFNSGVGPLGSNKTQYGFGWNTTPITVNFNPTWDVSATPITQFQGGGLLLGLSDFQIIFTDGDGNQSSVIIDTKNAEWSAPILFSDYDNFVPPTTIRRIQFQSLQLNKANGLIGFYDANDNPVIYETLAQAQARLTTKKTNIINSLSQ